jgi:hypothetical protein
LTRYLEFDSGEIANLTKYQYQYQYINNEQTRYLEFDSGEFVDFGTMGKAIQNMADARETLPGQATNAKLRAHFRNIRYVQSLAVVEEREQCLFDL